MPLPIILGVGAAVAGAVGIGSGIDGVVKMKNASHTINTAESLHHVNIERFERTSDTTSAVMDKLGKKELQILDGFQHFTAIFEKIHSKPQFQTYSKNGAKISAYNADELKHVSIGAGILLGGLGGAAIGTAGGFAAAGATTAAVMALGTASTGTTIASLSGAAATNAVLAALGGGAIAAGGGGIALGTMVLSATTFGIGLLVGGIVFQITGSSLSDKADEAWCQMKKAEFEIDRICSYMKRLCSVAEQMEQALSSVNKVYMSYLEKLSYLVRVDRKTDWTTFSQKEKQLVENTVLLVNLLFNMCKVQLVLGAENEGEINRVNVEDAKKSILDAHIFFNEKKLHLCN